MWYNSSYPMKENPALKSTFLHSWHEAAGARFASFAGFEMPIQYASAVEEHRLCRRSVGLFDTCHMGRFFLSGEEAGKALSSLTSASILDMEAGAARYSLLLNENGGILDDLFIYRLENVKGAFSWLVVVNAGNREADHAWLSERLPPQVSLEDMSDKTCMIAVQGPRAVELLDRIVGEAGNKDVTQGALKASAPRVPSVSAIPRAHMACLSLAGISVLIGRTGYTGEDGVEIYYKAENEEEAKTLWETILAEADKAGIEAGAVGLAARDSLRFEAGMPLHGHEISREITPLEALLSWACDFNKDFIGKEALLVQKASGLKRKLVTLNVTSGVPREGYSVLNERGAQIGTVVAGMFCPTTETYSANAFVPTEYSVVGTRLAVEIRGVPKEALVVKRPLYIPAYRRQT